MGFANSDSGKKNYDAAMNGDTSAGKGVHMYETPYLWKEDNIAIETDNPTENFVPTPVINTGDDSKNTVKKIVKIALIVLLIGFMIYALIANIIEDPGHLGIGNYRLID